MKNILVGITLLVVFLVVMAGAGVGTSWFGLVVSRPMQQYSKQTDNLVYLRSVAHQQGANSGIGIDCANMENASITPAERHAYAGMVVSDAAAYSGVNDLSPDSRDCVSKAHDIMSQPLQ